MKILIIKLGYSETLDPEIGETISLGDVLRTTVILHCFTTDHVTWLTDKRAYPLLADNPYINRVLFYDLTTVLQLEEEQFDIIINLEKVPGLCALTNKIQAWTRYGFRLDLIDGTADAYQNSQEIFTVYHNIKEKRKANKCWQEVLFEMINRKWDGEEYVLGYKPETQTSIDIGLNHLIGSKWPNKAWSNDSWETLYNILQDKRFNVSWQQGDNDLYDYMNWINQCEMIVTHDSLGLHLALALGKKVVGIFGPTASQEVHLYNQGKIITPSIAYDCIPCLRTTCHKDIKCIDSITPEAIYDEIERMINYGDCSNY